MTSPKDDDRDEEWFKEVYGKEYTGPTDPRERKQDAKDLKKRVSANPLTNAGESDAEEQVRDPNAVPTDFTSREAKVWEAKAKAIERNWKRRKEEELTCRICGETGHFPQGCPSTLGLNRKSSEVAETISVRDKQLKPRIIGTGGSVIQSLEKDTGCRLRLKDSHSGGKIAFTIHITGPNRSTVKRAVEFLNNLLDQLKDEPKYQNQRQTESLYGTPPLNPDIATQVQHIDTPHQNSSLQHGPGRNDLSKSYLDSRRVWEGGSPHALNGSGGSFSSLSFTQGRDASAVGYLSSFFKEKSSSLAMEDEGLYNHGEGQDRRLLHKNYDYLEGQREKQDIQARYDYPNLPQTLEELEGVFMFETRQLAMDRNGEEDNESARHHERMREIHAYYQQKMLSLKAKQLQRRDDLQNEQLNKQHVELQSGYNYHMPSTHSHRESALAQRSRSDPEFVYSLGNEPHPGGDQHQELSGYPYSRRRAASHSYSKNQAYDSTSFSYDESQHYP